MTIFLTNETSIEYDFSFEEVAEKVVEGVLDYEEFPFESSVEITLVDDETIHEINLENRQIDRATDVLSFPMIEYPSAGDYSRVEEDDDNFDPDTGEAMLGDIVISLEKVKQQSEEYGHSKMREYAFLICHSMLHLLGYDHMVEVEEKEMFQRQEAILEQLGITRDER